MRDPESYRTARRNACRETTHSEFTWREFWSQWIIRAPTKKPNRYVERRSATGKRWPIKSETLQQVKG